MRWFRIDKSQSVQPTSGDYNDWKEQIAEECCHQCVYCAIHEVQFGGQRNYHVEHYKPKSLPQFKDLEKSINNLFYACAICNTFKGNDWPNDWSSDCETVAYPDPSKFNYSDLFQIQDSFELLGISQIGIYIIHKLNLNRTQLILERRNSSISARYYKLAEEVTTLIEEIQGLERVDKDEKINILIDSLRILGKISSLNKQKSGIRPYKAEDVRRSH